MGSRLRHLRPRFSTLFRFEWAAWLALFAAVVAAAAALPRILLRFEFTDVLAETHPARVAYERYERDFELGPRLHVYFHGPGVFGAEFLRAVEAASARLERVKGMRSVFSAIDLREPDVRGMALRVRRVLSTDVLHDPPELARRLRAPPFTHRWHGMLYDRDLAVYAMVLTPAVEADDPRELVRFVRDVERELAPLAATGVSHHMHGMFFVNEEVFRVTSDSQARTTFLAIVVQTFVLWLLFGSLVASLQVTFLLNIAIFLGLGVMAAAGIPLNFLSGNFPVMMMVIGVADIIHILGAYTRALRTRCPRGAALKAMRETFFPNLFTTLTTLGCIYVTTYTDLDILRQFCLSLSLGIVIVWAVTILYGPFLFMRSGIRPDRGLIYPLRIRLATLLRTRWLGVVRRPATLVGFAVLGAVALGLSARQEINSNWFRYFSARSPVSKSLDFLQARGFPISVVDVTIAGGRPLEELLGDPRVERDVAKLEAGFGALPGVLEVYSLFAWKRAIDEVWPTLPFPETMAPVWREARRQAAYRQFLQGGLFDDYLSSGTRRLRIALTTRLEDSKSFLGLRDRVLEVLRTTEFEVLDAATAELPGQMLYWTVIIDSIGRTFFTSLEGSLLVILACFLALTRSPRRTLLALIPNVLPLLVVFGIAELIGQDLREDFCFFVSVSIGIAVDDTLHFLYHYGRARDRGAGSEAAVVHAFEIAGAPVIITSVVLVLGFSVCLEADALPMVLTGIFVSLSVLTALVADLWLMPALLLRVEGEREGCQPGPEAT